MLIVDGLLQLLLEVVDGEVDADDRLGEPVQPLLDLPQHANRSLQQEPPQHQWLEEEKSAGGRGRCELPRIGLASHCYHVNPRRLGD